MPPALQALKNLHTLDCELLGVNRAVEEALAELSLRESQLATAEKALEALRARDKDARKGVGLKELELKGFEAQIASWTVKLNTTRDNKEYQAIRHQIVTFQEQKGKLEEEILGLMDAEEGLHAGLTTEEAKVRETRQVFEARRREQEEAVRVRKAEAEALERCREGLLASVPSEMLARYDRIRRGRDGTGMAAVEEGACSGCRMGLTLNQQNQLLSDREMVTCQSCGRILYLAT